MPQHEKIDYVEFPCRDFAITKAFFTAVFGWTFVDYGESYMAFSNAGLEGGFYHVDMASSADDGGALIVFYSDDLSATEEKVKHHGGKIVKPTFDFPGGRRFHFTEPSGNEFAVWTAA